jgi:hypothetical protein
MYVYCILLLILQLTTFLTKIFIFFRDKRFKIQRGLELALDKKVMQIIYPTKYQKIHVLYSKQTKNYALPIQASSPITYYNEDVSIWTKKV